MREREREGVGEGERVPILHCDTFDALIERHGIVWEWRIDVSKMHFFIGLFPQKSPIISRMYHSEE